MNTIFNHTSSIVTADTTSSAAIDFLFGNTKQTENIAMATPDTTHMAIPSIDAYTTHSVSDGVVVTDGNQSVLNAIVATTGSVVVSKRGYPMNPNSLKNLRPKQKGEPANVGAGRPKGTKNLKNLIDKELERNNRGQLIAKQMVSQAESGSVQTQKLLLQIGGALNESPQVNIQNNTIIGDELLDAARDYLNNE